MAVRPDRSTFRTMLAVCAIALVVAFISSTLVLAKSPTSLSQNDNFSLGSAEKYGFRVVSMKYDRTTIFAP